LEKDLDSPPPLCTLAAMAERLNANALVVLPTLHAEGAVTLAQQLEKASLDEKGKPRKLPETIKEALQDIAADREALQMALGAAPAPESEIAAVDRVVDSLLRALYYNLEAWEILTDILPEGDEAEALRARIFGGDGLNLINLPAAIEWSVIDTKLKIIDAEKLAPRIEALGAGKILEHLREVHVRYGQVTGQKAQSAPESPQVRSKLDALAESLRHYVAAVVGAIVRKRPETAALADTLLQPLANWERTKPKRKSKAAGAKKTGEAPETTATGEAEPGEAKGG
jgi:hypothetical protein